MAMQETYQVYYMLSKAETKVHSIGSKINKLPVLAKLLIKPAASQIQPFPFYKAISMFKSNSILLFPTITAAIYWYYTWISIIISSLLLLKAPQQIKKVKIELVILFLISLLYILIVSTIAGDIRRLLPVYPIIFIFNIKLSQARGYKYRNIVTITSIISYLLLIGLYYYIKICLLF